MSNVGGVDAGSGVLGTGYVGLGSGAITGMSPDSLLEYCGDQLNNLNTQIDSLMTQQEGQIQESQAIQSVQSTLSAFGTSGPQNQSDLDKCEAAYQNAINSLPPGDPVAAQLQTQMQSMEQACGVTGQSLTPDQQAQLASAQAIVAQGAPPVGVPGTSQVNGAAMNQYIQAQTTVSQLTAITGSFKTPSQSDWAGVTSGLSTLNSNVTSNSQLQMLNLQNLVSQQQQAIEASTNMMTQENQTLLDQAKAV